MGSDVFTGQHLNNLSATHQELLSRLPELQDLQASWLLLLFCASPTPPMHPQPSKQQWPLRTPFGFAIGNGTPSSATTGHPSQPRASGPPAPRMAAARRQGHPPSLHCPSQPSPSRLPVRTLCEPSIHQHPIHRRVHLLFRTLSFAYASETPSAPPPVHQDLSMPSHS